MPLILLNRFRPCPSRPGRGDCLRGFAAASPAKPDKRRQRGLGSSRTRSGSGQLMDMHLRRAYRDHALWHVKCKFHAIFAKSDNYWAATDECRRTVKKSDELLLGCTGVFRRLAAARSVRQRFVRCRIFLHLHADSRGRSDNLEPVPKSFLMTVYEAGCPAFVATDGRSASISNTPRTDIMR